MARADRDIPNTSRVAIIGCAHPAHVADRPDRSANRQRRLDADLATSRHAHTLAPQGGRRTLFRPGIVGTGEEILALAKDPVLPLVSEFRLELPYAFELDDCAQILTDFARLAASCRPHRTHVSSPSSGREGSRGDGLAWLNC